MIYTYQCKKCNNTYQEMGIKDNEIPLCHKCSNKMIKTESIYPFPIKGKTLHSSKTN